MPKNVTVTVKQVAEAMIADPSPQAFDIFYLPGSAASCAVGGAARVLNVRVNDLFDALHRVDRDGVPHPFGYPSSTIGSVIVASNDNKRWTKAEIGKLLLDHADSATLNTQLLVGARR